MTELILIRGLPGSGKSTLAERLFNSLSPPVPSRQNPDYEWFEADMFFCYPQSPWGTDYCWEADKVADAHKWCQDNVRTTLSRGDCCIVSNTFTRMWEMLPYLKMAKEVGARVTVITCEGNNGNVHSVPEDVIEKMRARWEPYVPLNEGE